MDAPLESSTDCVCVDASRDKHEIQVATSLTNGTGRPGKLWQHAVEAEGGGGGAAGGVGGGGGGGGGGVDG